jgi:hypothetical protein
MQDDNPQLSRWFASRPDAKYVFITNQRRKQMTDAQLQMEADDLIAKYKDEIIEQGDWWWGTDTHSFNIHCLDDECDGWYNVNVYKVDPVTGMDSYEWMIDLPRVFIKGEMK